MTNRIGDSPHFGNSAAYIEERRVQALTRIAQEATPAYIAQLIARAGDGDEDVLQALAWDCLTVDDLRELLQSRKPAEDVLAEFKWTGKYTGPGPRLFIVCADLDHYLAFVEKHGLDPYRTHHYASATEASADMAHNEAVGARTEVVILGGAA